jgi:murein tripeptide amidase MpaA
MRQLVESHPGKARLLALPVKSLEGRTIYGIEIATGVDTPGGRPVFYMDGVHHAREWPAAEMPIMFAFDLLESYETDERIRAIVDGARTVIIPVMNPDGYNYSREAVIDVSGVGHPAVGSAYWRKNKRSTPHALDPVFPSYGAYGIDPNRNYPANWGDNAGGSSGSQSSETYRGTAPSSEPEVTAIRELMLSLPVTGGITHHTYGRLVLRAWGHTTVNAPDEALMKQLGDAMAAFNGYTSQKSRQLYTTTGTHSDWMYAALGTIGYTFEHTTAFHPAYSNIPPMYVSNRPAFLLLAEAAMNTDYISVIRGRAVDAEGQPVQAGLRINREFDSPLWFNGSGQNPIGQGYFREEQDISWETEPDGTFELHLPPSTRPAAPDGVEEAYPLTVSAEGLPSRTVDVVVHRGEVEDLEDVVLSEVSIPVA